MGKNKFTVFLLKIERLFKKRCEFCGEKPTPQWAAHKNDDGFTCAGWFCKGCFITGREAPHLMFHIQFVKVPPRT